MCGIAGILNFQTDDKVDEQLLVSLQNDLYNRGPDNKGLKILNNGCLGFVHTRLSIIDLTKYGDQPLTCSEGRVTITFNGEIYNYKELKEILVENNFTFKSNSDTEVILNYYKFKGIDGFNDLRGMYAFAIWDKKINKLFLARDPNGIKPLYYYKDNKKFCFSSQFKSIYKLPFIEKKISKKSEFLYFLWGNIPKEYTLQENIFSLAPASILEIDQNNKEKSKNHSIQINFSEVEKNLETIIKQTCEYHSVSDVPISIFLSSGLDSSIILYYLNKINNLNKNLCALTIGFESFEGSNLDEVKLAKKLTSELKVEHKVKIFKRDELLESLPKFFEAMDLPTTDGYNTWLISDFAKQNNFKVSLSGVGGDEIFYGYEFYNQLDNFYRYKKYLPNWILNKILKTFNLNNQKVNYLTNYANSIEMMFLLKRCANVFENLKDSYDAEIISKYIDEYLLENRNFQPINNQDKLVALDEKYYLVSRLLRDIDWASMAHSLEIRTPFVDSFFKIQIKKLQAFKKKQFNKSYLKVFFSNKINKEILTKKKTGFEIPYKKIINYDKNECNTWTRYCWENYIKQLH